MRYTKRYKVLSAVAAIMAFEQTSRADFSYNFDNGNVTGSPSPGTPLVNGTTPGTVGQDNWVNTSGTSGNVLTDPVTGFSGNYLAANTAIATNGFDNVSSRLGDNLGLGSQYATFQFDGEVGPGYINSTGSTVAKRSEVWPGIDANGNGNIRGTASAGENNESAFQFGYDSTGGGGWFLRRAAFSNTGSITTASTASGVYTMQLVVNFQANPVTISGQQYFDGSGTLYVKQLADASGNAVSDVFRQADPLTTNFDLFLSSNMGTGGAANPANWDGMFARVANNGGVDNILFKDGLPNVPPTWATNAGNWLSASNWYLTVPNAVGAEADFTAGATADSTVFADSAVTVGTMKFDNQHMYVIAGAGSLTLQTSSGSAQVNVLQAGTQKINLPLFIASNTSFNVAGGATLKISDPMTVNQGKTLTQTGSGAVVYESNVNLLTGSSIVLGSAVSMNALSISTASSAWTSTVDAGNHDLVLRTGNLAQLASQVKSGFNNGAWNGTGITSSAAAANASHHTALGYASAASLLGLSGSGTATFDGQTVDASSLIVKYTWSGDANLDGTVNSSDFAMLAANFGATGKVWQSGDFNYDGTVNALDFNALANGYGNSTPPPAEPLAMAGSVGSLVPEPATIGLFITGSVGLLMRRRRMN